MANHTNRGYSAGRVAIRWYLFLVFFHLLPVPWFIAVTGGLAPAGYLMAIGVPGLFNSDFDSLPLSAMFLIPGLTSSLIYVLFSYWLAAAIGRLKKPVAGTLSLIIILAVCLGVALNPVFILGGHGGGDRSNLIDLIDNLSQFRIPVVASWAYFVGLALLLVGLLAYQHAPRIFPNLPLNRKRRRSLLRRSLLGALIIFIALFC